MKKNYIILVLLLLIGISIGYAVINSTLLINGRSNIEKNTWDIHFNNVLVKEGSVEALKLPTIENSTTVDFEVLLDLPGDYYEFTVDVVNNGTIDAMIESIEKFPGLSEEQAKYLNYTVTYENGEAITTKQLVESESFVRLKINVEYKNDISVSDLPANSETLTLSFTLNYVQADDSGKMVKDNGVFGIIASSSLDEIGTLVTIGTEQFYVIGSDNENVELLSMYNLYVGGSYDGTVWTPYGDEATGMQDKNMNGYSSKDSNSLGVTEFSNSTYTGEHGTTYNGSLVEKYVNDYENLLEEKFGVDIVDSRLITLDELIDPDTFGCDGANQHCVSTNYPWIYSTSYWTDYSNGDASLASYNYVCSVTRDGFITYFFYYIKNNVGVRPVIKVKKSDVIVSTSPRASGDINEIGSVVTIGTEKFYTIGTEGNNVKLLSMYNLYVGGEHSDEFVSYNSEATGMQNIKMKGFTSIHDTYRRGVTSFSNVNNVYSGSLVEGYVNDYKNLLESKFDVDIINARLINYDELASTFNCTPRGKCPAKYSWIYNSSYWSGDSSDSFEENTVWGIMYDGTFSYYNYSSNIVFGVRPVIVISKDYF